MSDLFVCIWHTKMALYKYSSFPFPYELNHAPYCSDMAPSDYILFRYLKKHLCGRQFSSNIVSPTFKQTIYHGWKDKIPTSTWPEYHHSQQSAISAQNSREIRVISNKKSLCLAVLYYNLHWLPVPQQIRFKIAFFASNCIQHVCMTTANLSGRAGLCSAERGDLAVPRTATELHKRSFSVATPANWNSLPEYFHSSSISSFEVD